MSFMQCVTEESDEQNPFVLHLNGGLILETVNKYCLLQYYGKIFLRIFFWLFIKEPLDWGELFKTSLLSLSIILGLLWYER